MFNNLTADEFRAMMAKYDKMMNDKSDTSTAEVREDGDLLVWEFEDKNGYRQEAHLHRPTQYLVSVVFHPDGTVDNAQHGPVAKLLADDLHGIV